MIREWIFDHTLGPILKLFWAVELNRMAVYEIQREMRIREMQDAIRREKEGPK